MQYPIPRWTDPQEIQKLEALPKESLVAIIAALSNYYFMSEQGLKDELHTKIDKIIKST